MIMKQLALSVCVILAMLFSACGDDEGYEPAYSYSSHRDGTYSGKRLEITLDGKPMTGVSSVSIKSRFLDAVYEYDSIGNVTSNYPIFITEVFIKGFPCHKKAFLFRTVSDFDGFKGHTTVDMKNYRYTGEFTGNPFEHPDKQGLVLRMETED